MDEVFKLRSGENCALVAALGAELRSWQVAGQELMWGGAADSWAKTAPVLFPVVGWCRDGQIRVDGRSFAMPVHGFASRRNFGVTAQSESRMTLRLDADAATRAHYPFDFALTLTIALEGESLTYDCVVENRDTGPLPYALGLHPGFRWPLSGAGEHCIETEADELPFVPVIAPGGLFSDDMRPVPLAGRKLALSRELMAKEALCFLNARSRSLRYIAPDGASLRCNWQGFDHFALWNRNAAEFLCIEFWTGYGDPVGFTGDLREKPGMILLPPQMSAQHSVTFSYLRA